MRERTAAVRAARDELERRVAERTSELQEMAGGLLIEVRERARAVGHVRALLRLFVGGLEIECTPGAGTTVFVRVPLPDSEEGVGDDVG